jgi:hypothetical protein
MTGFLTPSEPFSTSIAQARVIPAAWYATAKPLLVPRGAKWELSFEGWLLSFDRTASGFCNYLILETNLTAAFRLELLKIQNIV